MTNREASASRRLIVMSPNAPRAAELEAILETQFEGVPVHRLQAYPSPRDLPTAIAAGIGHVVFLDVASEPGQALELLGEMARMSPHVYVIALLDGNDPDLILRCLRAGAVEFLMHPFTAEQVESAFSKLARLQGSAEVQSRDPAKIYAVMPAKGACGATTLAANLAFQMKKMGAERVLLADLDTLAGTLSFVLKLKSSYSFLDALQRASELDHDLWNAMVTEANGVDVLLAPDLMSENAHELADPSPVFEYARQVYDVVVVDCAGVYGEWNLNIARAVNDLLLVSTNELPALQAAQRALSYLDSNRIGRWKVRLVVNRYLRDVGLSREVIGTALHTDVFETLPSDYEAVQRALLEGKPILANTVLGKAMAHLAQRLGGPPKSASKKSSSLGGLLNLFSKTSK
ncbi:MAG TPA: AAA family ATPase [Bryobacteraceae bacterium]|nr:AAA family ATPase [Bryobacteraceae bacterium]